MENNSTKNGDMTVGYNLVKANGLLQIFDEKMQAELPTITTSPQAAEQFKKRYDELTQMLLWSAMDLIKEATDITSGNDDNRG